jgi:hypothetical protein
MQSTDAVDADGKQYHKRIDQANDGTSAQEIVAIRGEGGYLAGWLGHDIQSHGDQRPVRTLLGNGRYHYR